MNHSDTYASVQDSGWMLAEPQAPYGNDSYPLQKETYAVIGCCMEVHRALGHGFAEIVYKDALMHELMWKGIGFERERQYKIQYKGVQLPHYYHADFVVQNSIILEVKAQEGIHDDQYAQVINYLAVSGCPIGLLVNFGERSLKYRRIILTK